jgi:hypothetical protein
MKAAKALLGAAMVAIALAGSTTTRAQPPVIVTATATLVNQPNIPEQVSYLFLVTNNLGGTYKIYQFGMDVSDLLPEYSEPGFSFDFSSLSWSTIDYDDAIGPGQRGGFEGIQYGDQIIPDVGWEISVENSAGAKLFFSGAAETVPESSTWAMMLIGFAGLGLCGYRASRRTATG